MQTYFITSTNEAKLYYGMQFTNNKPEIMVYDRDSDSGLSIITNYKAILDEDSTLFMQLHKSCLFPNAIKKFMIALWNEQLYDDNLEEAEVELHDYLDKLCNDGDIYAIYFREKYIFQRRICQFSEEWLDTYKGEFANADKTTLTGGIG